MRALTLIQPWATCISHGSKRIENRGWRPSFVMLGQKLAIHAGTKLDLYAVEAIRKNASLIVDMPEPDAMVRSAVVAVATLAGWGRLSPPGSYWTPSWGLHPRQSDLLWYAVGECGWVLDDVVALPEPVPCRGRQGLWPLPADVEAAVRAQVGL